MRTTDSWPVLLALAVGAAACGSDTEKASSTDAGSSSSGGSSGTGGAGTGSTPGASGGTSGGSGSGGSSGGASSGGTSGGSSGGASSGGTSGGSSGGASSGGTSSGGMASTGGVPGAGGEGSECPPECLVANECVAMCGETPRNYGCCPCPATQINVRSCGSETDGVSCDQRAIQCRRATPVCDDGSVPSVVGTCYGPCVPIDWCVCDGPDFCPYEEMYTCHNSAGRCGPYVQ